MKQLICEMCGSADMIKRDNVFVCQYCGAKYSVEEAKKLLVDGHIDISGSTIKIDTSDELANLYQIARRAKNDGNDESAIKYYEMILVKDPNSWEATFYIVYLKALNCTYAAVHTSCISVENCIDTVFDLIKKHIHDKNEQKEAYTDVSTRILGISNLMFAAAKKHYYDTDAQIRAEYFSEYINSALAALDCAFCLGNNLETFFSSDEEAINLAVTAWKQGIEGQQFLVGSLENKEEIRNNVQTYSEKIKKYDNSYTPPKERGGCYIATAVYGSYDCPQVWTLRRYRDYSLAKTWYGRTFIKVYYALSPTAVRLFGRRKWFQKTWRKRLDRMVKNLNANGVEDTPYKDKNW